MNVECMVYIFDEANRYQLYTPALMADYINNIKDNVSIDITIGKGGLVFKNQWFDDWKIPEFLSRDVVDSNAVFTITTEEPVRPNCTENWPLLPINVMYSSILETEDGQSSISLDSLSFRWYLLADIPHPYPVFDNLRLCRKLPAWNTLTKAARWTT
jgi:hypothetical protein